MSIFLDTNCVDFEIQRNQQDDFDDSKDFSTKHGLSNRIQNVTLKRIQENVTRTARHTTHTKITNHPFESGISGKLTYEWGGDPKDAKISAHFEAHTRDKNDNYVKFEYSVSEEGKHKIEVIAGLEDKNNQEKNK